MGKLTLGCGGCSGNGALQLEPLWLLFLVPLLLWTLCTQQSIHDSLNYRDCARPTRKPSDPRSLLLQKKAPEMRDILQDYAITFVQ